MLLKNKRIFIVEDNVTNRTVMQIILEQAGAVVYFERWGHETLIRLKNFAPVHLILLDLVFPDGISGYDIFQDIRATPSLSSIPIVAVSASNRDIALTKTRDMGFNGFIAKPITDHGEFIQWIVSVLEGHSVWDDAL